MSNQPQNYISFQEVQKEIETILIIATIELNSISHLLDAVKKGVDQTLKEREKALLTSLGNLYSDLDDEQLNIPQVTDAQFLLSVDHQFINKVLPNFAYQSVTITIFGIFEKAIKAACFVFDVMELSETANPTEIEIKKAIKKRERDHISNSISFFTQNICKDINKTKIWPKIQSWKTVRNAATHTNGYIEEEQIGKLKNLPGIKIKDNHIQFDRQLCRQMISDFLDFINWLNK